MMNNRSAEADPTRSILPRERLPLPQPYIMPFGGRKARGKSNKRLTSGMAANDQCLWGMPNVQCPMSKEVPMTNAQTMWECDAVATSEGSPSPYPLPPRERERSDHHSGSG